MNVEFTLYYSSVLTLIPTWQSHFKRYNCSVCSVIFRPKVGIENVKSIIKGG